MPDMHKESAAYDRWMGYSADDLYDEQESDRCLVCGETHADVCEFCRQCPSLCECDAKLDELAERPTPDSERGEK